MTTGDYDKTARTTSEVYQREVLDLDLQGYQGLYKLMEKRMVGGQKHYFVKKDAIEAFLQEWKTIKKNNTYEYQTTISYFVPLGRIVSEC